MNGAHDCGGMMGFGPVVAEENEPVFHAPWEARMFALMSAVGDVGGWTLDEDRAACEAMEPGRYITTSYYEHWLNGLELLLPKHGLATAEEMRTGHAAALAKNVTPTAPQAVWPAVTAHGSYRREVPVAPAFRIGDRVRTRHLNPSHHTRLPRYLRGHMGEIVAHHGAHVFPDSNAQGKGEDPRHLYTVRFAASELWGRPSRDVIHADLWGLILKLADSDRLPKDADGPVFAEPWEAQAFAMAVKLNEAGIFTWHEWAEMLGAELKAQPDRPYYESWLAALEGLVEAKGVMSGPERIARVQAWDRAAKATPHGQPIQLNRD